MPAGSYFKIDIPALGTPEEVSSRVTDKIGPTLNADGFTLVDESATHTRWTRRYWPAGAIAGLVILWGLAAISWTNAPTDYYSGDKNVPLGTYIAAAIAVVCIFIRRTAEIRIGFERRENGTMVRVTGLAPSRTQKSFTGMGNYGPGIETLGDRVDAQQVATAARENPVAQIAALAELRKDGSITEAEFEQQKAKLLDQI